MEALILNRKFETLCFLDSFESFIWTDRYAEPGDFEIYMPVKEDLLDFMVIDNYVWRHGTDRLMIIENVTIETDAEEGSHITITGRSLESILERRVIDNWFTYSGSLEEGIKTLLNDNIISPQEDARKIDNFRFLYSNDTDIQKLTCDWDYLGDDLLTVIEDACNENEIGFKVTFNEELETMDFKLYAGEDRSYEQDHNPWVVFSAKYDNLSGSKYYETHTALKTMAVVAGDDSYERGQVILDVMGKEELKGLDRREMFVDASDVELPNPTVNEDAIHERYDDHPKIDANALIAYLKERAIEQTEEVYYDQLRQKAKEELAKTYITKSFDGFIEAKLQYIYGEDFFLGDIVQICDRYGREAASRITEIVMAHDTSGEMLLPTFTTLFGGANEGDINDY